MNACKFVGWSAFVSMTMLCADQIAVATFEQAAGAAAQLGFPVVIKPSHGLQGRGALSASITSRN